MPLLINLHKYLLLMPRGSICHRLISKRRCRYLYLDLQLIMIELKTTTVSRGSRSLNVDLHRQWWIEMSQSNSLSKSGSRAIRAGLRVRSHLDKSRSGFYLPSIRICRLWSQLLSHRHHSTTMEVMVPKTNLSEVTQKGSESYLQSKTTQ